MEFIRANAKAILAFVITVLLQAVTDAINSGDAPTSLIDWARYLGLSLLAGIVVWATGNKLDVGQILSGMKKLPVPEQKEVAQQTLNELPNNVSDAVVAGYPNFGLG